MQHYFMSLTVHGRWPRGHGGHGSQPHTRAHAETHFHSRTSYSCNVGETTQKTVCTPMRSGPATHCTSTQSCNIGSAQMLALAQLSLAGSSLVPCCCSVPPRSCPNVRPAPMAPTWTPAHAAARRLHFTRLDGSSAAGQRCGWSAHRSGPGIAGTSLRRGRG